MGRRAVLLAVAAFAAAPYDAGAQFFDGLVNLFSNLWEGPPPPFGSVPAHHQVAPAPNFIDDGTQFPRATGFDEPFPRDCGRNTDDGTGKLCFPDGVLCQNSECVSRLPRPTNNGAS